MEEQRTDQHPQDEPYQTRLRQQREEDRRFVMSRSWWHSPLVGYLICPFLVGLASIVDLSFQRLGLKLYTAAAPLYLANVVIAWLWGVGPALLAIVFGYLALDIFLIPPFGVFTFNGWNDLVIFLPFIFTQLLVVLITAQREKARQRAYIAEQRAERHVQELAEANQDLSQGNLHLGQLTSTAWRK